jgi:hypothetical protein
VSISSLETRFFICTICLTADAGSGDPGSPQKSCGIPAENHSAGSRGACRHPIWSFFFSAAAIAQHQRVSHLDLGGMRNRMVVDPAVEGSNI